MNGWGREDIHYLYKDYCKHEGYEPDFQSRGYIAWLEKYLCEAMNERDSLACNKKENDSLSKRVEVLEDYVQRTGQRG